MDVAGEVLGDVLDAAGRVGIGRGRGEAVGEEAQELGEGGLVHRVDEGEFREDEVEDGPPVGDGPEVLPRGWRWARQTVLQMHTTHTMHKHNTPQQQQQQQYQQ